MRRLGLVIAAAMLASALMVGGMTTAATAGGGSDATVAAGKKKKKKCPAGTTKKVVKKKNGKKKITCVPAAAPPTTPPLGATLSITPTSHDFGNLAQGGNCNPPPDPDCPIQPFTVSNAGPGPSGTPVPSIVIVSTNPGDDPAFTVFGTTCTGPLAPGATCTVSVRAATDDNFAYVSRLDVSGSPGGTASATLMAQ